MLILRENKRKNRGMCKKKNKKGKFEKKILKKNLKKVRPPFGVRWSGEGRVSLFGGCRQNA